MAHPHREVVVADLEVELGNDEAVKVVWRVDLGFEPIALAVAPVGSVHQIDTAANVHAAAIGLDLAFPAHPELIHFILVAAIVGHDRSVPAVHGTERIEGHALFQPAVLLDSHLLQGFRLGKGPGPGRGGCGRRGLGRDRHSIVRCLIGPRARGRK